MAIFIKHIREPYDPQDGLRYLVCDMPPGFTREELKLEGWIRELSPGTVQDNMNDDEWKIFRRTYYERLIQPERSHWLDLLARQACESNITILFVESHGMRNHAAVLKTVLELKIKAESEEF